MKFIRALFRNRNPAGPVVASRMKCVDTLLLLPFVRADRVATHDYQYRHANGKQSAKAHMHRVSLGLAVQWDYLRRIRRRLGEKKQLVLTMALLHPLPPRPSRNVNEKLRQWRLLQTSPVDGGPTFPSQLRRRFDWLRLPEQVAVASAARR